MRVLGKVGNNKWWQRIWLACAGIVTTLVTQEQLGQLLAIAKELNLNMTEQAEPPTDALTDLKLEDGNIDTAKKNLDDLFNLL